VDQKIGKQHRKLGQMIPEINNTSNRSVELEEKIKVIDQEINTLFEKSQKLGEEGKIEESELLTNEIDKLV